MQTKPARHYFRPVPGRGASILVLAAAALLPASLPSHAEEARPLKIAVFDFELDDRSAGAGIRTADAMDEDNLRKATEEAKRILADSGRYDVVDTATAEDGIAAAGGIKSCNGCEAAAARQLGADQSMAGLIARVSRTEYTLQVVVRDADTGQMEANHFSGLRMGANYAWPRGAKALMNKVVPAPPQQK
ncbi:hypothetical protein HDIA_0035 [Hartmannibacter diazotrophicus]|uniref:DUF2380 domain-containing protein n=1 Tax=Hartmannibacter diazotrophicus TaxID=1482074 RepID=A0A2C9D002_9HYPH|nr:DUF3280 domain-containing protein [Hartmannibacter diazotrophicus]SON53576.1 hypothetical protein HDIA_0035 [Hartmannibacter diazotrophicus]